MSQDDLTSRAADSLEGQLLIAMPAMGDPRFEHSVIFMCAHAEDSGAMGLIVNKELDNISFADLASQLDLTDGDSVPDIPIQYGGPVETGRGFVLHTNDYDREATVPVGDGVGMTATVDILRAMARGEGPRKSLLVLGYAGWAPGQLEGEIQRNDWLHCGSDEAILFDTDHDEKWTAAFQKIGFDPALLSTGAGRA